MSKRLMFSIFFVISALALNADLPWDNAYQQFLLKKVGEKLPEITNYPVFQYPNKNHDKAKALENGKILIFGYGSLISPDIDRNKKCIKQENLITLRPAIAFGVKRLFNIRATVSKILTSKTLDPKERCFLNLVPTTDYHCVTNGVVVEVDQEDLTRLVAREIGYDLVPLFVASWDDAVRQSGGIKIEIAYTFLASGELRDHVSYTSNELYPIRWYASVVDQAAKYHGPLFWKTYQKTTWLADGTTLITDWQGTFDAPLNRKE
jgi:hypothetical protein